MARMFYGLEEDVVRTRIRKFRDVGSHPKNRLVEAAVLVDLVERMLDTPTEDEAPAPDTHPDPQPEPDEHPEEDTEFEKPSLLGRIFK